MLWVTRRTIKALDIPDAEGHYLRAIELDPNFAMAYARLGVVYANSGQLAKANNYFAKAYELSKHVSERERLYITGHYYRCDRQPAQGDRDAAGGDPGLPGQVDSYVNINVGVRLFGSIRKGASLAQKSVEVQPEDAIASENLVDRLRRLEPAWSRPGRRLERARKLGLDNSYR